MLRWGIVSAFVGFALVLVAMVMGQAVGPEALIPFLLLGCLPMFFGLALLVIYALSRKDNAGNDLGTADFADDPIPPHKQ